MNDPTTISAFLAGKRIALVGASTNERDFSRVVLRELVQRGYDVIPVRPGAQTMDGRTVHARVQDVPGAVDGALVMTPPSATDAVVRDCIEAGIRRIWLHRGVGRGSVTDGAVATCREHGVAVVAGECPLMFLAGGNPVHHIHAATKWALGRYPSQPPAVVSARRAALLALHGAIGWAACAAAMAALLALTTSTAAAAVHTLLAPLVFATVASVYFRRPDPVPPLATAAVFAGVTALLDAAVIAGLVLRDFTMFASLRGTWLPFLLIFVATLAVGLHRMNSVSPPAASPGH